MFKKTATSFAFKIGLISILAIAGAFVIGTALLILNPKQSALFADNILRPLLGDQAVINLEGVLFNIEDHINRLYKSQPSSNSYTTGVKTQTATAQSNTPRNIAPVVDQSHPLTGEGIWRKITGTELLTTFIRTDPNRPYSIVNLVYIPMKHIDIRAVAGTKYPGGPMGFPGPGKVPINIQQSGQLIAAFNGGFKEKDGHYGMFTDNITYVPLKIGFATLFIFKDGHVSLQPYDGNPLPSNIVAARQNGLFLVKDSRIQPVTSQGIDYWAGTAKGGYITWRSGIGVTPNGDLIYAVGPSLTPTALADALLLAGGQNAMQLDINPYWVRFMLYTWNNKLDSYTWSPLTKGLADGGKSYLQGYEKDFFYLYTKQT